MEQWCKQFKEEAKV